MTAPLTIASSLTEFHSARIEAHRGVGRVIRLTASPWLVPAEAEVLMTYQTQWKSAPETAPPDWPGRLKWMQVASAGVDTFPHWALSVPLVTRGRGVQAPAIAEFALAAIMAHEKRLFDAPMRGPADWSAKPLGGISGKALGIAGYGAIGQELARRAHALGMEVLALRRHPPLSKDESGTVIVSNLRELAARSHHLVVALPKTPETVCCVNADVLERARPGLHLINVARGDIVDDAAILAALESGRLSAVTLDVTTPEPLPEGHPFWSHPRVRLTPHVSGASESTEERLSALLLSNIDRYLDGETPVGQVNAAAGY